MNSDHAARQIAMVRDIAGTRLWVGAGTVTDVGELETAIHAGAQFIVTPAVDEDVLAACRQRALPVFPGAFTPTEVQHAHRLGATMVKLFPADRLGPEYFKHLRAPFGKIPLLATGGITPETLPAYRKAGAAGFGLGSPLLAPERIETRDWDSLRDRATQFRLAWQNSSSS